MRSDWNTTCIGALRKAIAETKKPIVVGPIVDQHRELNEFMLINPLIAEQFNRWSERMADLICDGALDT